jgi:flagellar hook-basal body complex protein FliE
MSVPSIGAVGTGVDLSALADLYRQQITAGTSTSGTSSVGSALGLGSTAGGTASVRGAEFGNLIANSLSELESLDKTASAKAIQAATGDLTDIQDYIIAATQAQTATELTTTIRNKALDSFNEIMRMSL